MLTTAVSGMTSPFLDLTKKEYNSPHIDMNCLTLSQLFRNMTMEQKQAITEVDAQNSFISDQEIILLAENCPFISKLNLTGAHRIGNKALKVIAERFKDSLEELNVCFASNHADQTTLWGNTRVFIPELKKDVEWITDEGVVYLLKTCHKLSKLDLTRTQITAKTLEAFAAKTYPLYLEINSCYQLAETKEQRRVLVHQLRQARPNLTIIDENSDRIKAD